MAKNITLIVADSLRYDTYSETLKACLKELDLPFIDYGLINSKNSCTKLSLPWMLSGMEVFSPNMCIPKDLEKRGYFTCLLHSNPIVDQFNPPFNKVIDLSNKSKTGKLSRKYNRVRYLAEKYLPSRFYNFLKAKLQGTPENYLPYTRIYDTLPYIPIDNPSFAWVHLMDPHTPYYPVEGKLTYREIIDLNNYQISAVRGYYMPSEEEKTLWYDTYRQESLEMSQFLVKYLECLDYSENIVLFTSDHGEEFGEYGEYGHKGNRFNPENIDVPLLVFGENLPDTVIRDHSQLRGYIRRLID